MYGVDAAARAPSQITAQPGGGADAWLTPLDCRINTKRETSTFIINSALAICGLIGLSIGLMTLYTEPWELMPPWIRGFVVWTMSLELLVGALVGVAAGLLYLTLGKIAVIHSLSVISLGSDALLSFTYAIICIWGFFAMKWLLNEGCFDSIMCYSPWKIGNSQDCKASPYLQFYILLNWIAATSYTISRIPTLWGALAFATYKVKNKLQHTPIVQFYTEYNRGDDFYTRVISLEECAELIERMDNPLK